MKIHPPQGDALPERSARGGAFVKAMRKGVDSAPPEGFFSERTGIVWDFRSQSAREKAAADLRLLPFRARVSY